MVTTGVVVADRDTSVCVGSTAVVIVVVGSGSYSTAVCGSDTGAVVSATTWAAAEDAGTDAGELVVATVVGVVVGVTEPLVVCVVEPALLAS